MDLLAWKNKVHERLQAFACQVNKNTPGMLYGALAAMRRILATCSGLILPNAWARAYKNLARI